jgi:hypothetical protein
MPTSRLRFVVFMTHSKPSTQKVKFDRIPFPRRLTAISLNLASYQLIEQRLGLL